MANFGASKNAFGSIAFPKVLAVSGISNVMLNPTLIYNYDSLGNITSRIEDGSVAFNYDYSLTPHAVTKVEQSNGDALRYLYDANGNMIGREADDATYLQTFDIENRLTEVETIQAP